MKTLVLGGARSGKSEWAEHLVTPPDSAASPDDVHVTYVATARPWGSTFDADFARRIERHRARRPSWWHTEDSRDLVDVLTESSDQPAARQSTILVDDLGTWLTHELAEVGMWDAEFGSDNWNKGLHAIGARRDRLITALRHVPADGPNLVVVSPEVGMGIVPSYPSGGVFRDELGRLNADVASVCDRVVLVVAGCALDLRS